MRAKKMIILIGLVVLALIALVIASRVPSLARPSQQAKDPDEAARLALENFRTLVNKSNYKDLGFQSLDEVKKATLGPSLQVFMVGLGQLKEYQPGQDPQKLFIEIGRVIYPVMVDDQLRTSLEVEKSGEEWQGTSFGNPNLIQMLSRVRQEKTDFVVWIPALNLYFIGSKPTGELLLVPVLDDPQLKLFAGKAIPAGEAFAQILPTAKEHDGPVR